MGSIAAFISAPKTSNILLGLIIFFSATQLGYHFWPASALVYGIRVDYLAPTLYFLDLLLILSIIGKKITLPHWFVGLLPVLVVNLLFSHNPAATLSWSLHFLLYLMFVFSLPSNIPHQPLTVGLSLTILFQVTLALAQVALGHSLQGPLYYLGERMVAVGSPGVATAPLLGANVLRAYSTFSHPNILAGYLVISYLIILRLAQSAKFRFLRLVKIKTYTLSALVTLGLLLTQSRSAAFAFFGLILPFSLLRSMRSRLIYFAILLFASCYLLFTNSFSRPLDLSLSQRLTLQELSMSVVHSYPIFGTGAQASISTYPLVSPNTRILQPDHNSFTLITSWLGLFGVFAIIYAMRSILFPNFYFLIPIAPLIFLDHYLLTSPQGLFVFILYLKVVHSYHAQSRR